MQKYDLLSLSLNNICIGNYILQIEACESTNIYAKNLMAKNEPMEGTVIITDKQTKGKGQFGNKWLSEDYKNLTLSIILKPTFLAPAEQFYLSKIVSLACLDTFLDFDVNDFTIKWPNDIYFKNKKIGGVLIENSISSTQINDCVIGVGLNINQNYFKNLATAISLKNIIDKEVSLEEILAIFLKKLDVFYLMLRNRKLLLIDSLYKKNLLGIEKTMNFVNTETLNNFQAKVIGVNTLGQLHLEINNESVFFNFKEVSWIL